ncbi:winged helix-turn-helix domain-containing protein [Gordonia hongkongensis]|uniref:winged helix-turn-helix domain-containing protein n=1 Tax=Gordonia hongkongensis TaxID=1701090 RepID=UPI003BF7956A
MTQPVSPFPTKSELTRPLLELMSNDQTWSRAELKDAVADAFRLPPKVRAETVKSGGTRLETRVSWALRNLKLSGAVEATGPGRTHITSYGHQVLSEHPERLTSADLEASPQYLDDSSAADDDENLPVCWFVGAVFGDAPGDEAYDHTDQFRTQGSVRRSQAFPRSRFQLYAYVQSQHGKDALSTTAEGVLLYLVRLRREWVGQDGSGFVVLRPDPRGVIQERSLGSRS